MNDRSSPGFAPAAILAMLVAAAPGASLSAQQPIRLSRLIAAFLVDSGVQTRGLAWTTGNDLPVRWRSAQPIRVTDAGSIQRGVTLSRTGSVRVVVDDSITLPMTVTTAGGPAGLVHVVFAFTSLEVTTRNGSGFLVHREMVENALRHDGVTLTPLKCSRATEGASYGNLVDAVKVPGKTASGLWWFWQSVQQSSELSLSLIYRRADMAQVECYSG